METNLQNRAVAWGLRMKGKGRKKSGIKKGGIRKSWIRKIVMGILSSSLMLLLMMVLVGMILYKSGEISLKASANMSAPQIYVGVEEINKIKENLEYIDSVAWQDNWVIYDDKVYEYRENTLNFLLLGIDQSGSLSKKTELSDWNAGQADTIFLVTLNQEDKRLSVIGIPRNSMVDVEVYKREIAVHARERKRESERERER